ncbi:MAG: class I SAM-dependent methyltransferase [Candidatus Omnitrophica bacterium]|nr:class I SAM-dependent methyltransferase [Candidatus Omnitrophota bacterium]
MDNVLFENKYLDAIDAACSKQGNYFAPALERFSTYIRNDVSGRILDVGCGNGVFTVYLKKLVDGTLYGADMSEYALESARKNGFDVTQKIGDLSVAALPFADGFFDAVIIKDVFEHLLFPANLLKEIARVTRKGGHILVLVPNHFTLFKRVKFLFTGSIDTFGYFPRARAWEYPHIRFFSAESLKAFIVNDGAFTVAADLGYLFPDKLPWINRIPGYSALTTVLAKRFPSLMVEGLTLVARKI